MNSLISSAAYLLFFYKDSFGTEYPTKVGVPLKKTPKPFFKDYFTIKSAQIPLFMQMLDPSANTFQRRPF